LRQKQRECGIERVLLLDNDGAVQIGTPVVEGVTSDREGFGTSERKKSNRFQKKEGKLTGRKTVTGSI
jgi:ribosomal protein L21